MKFGELVEAFFTTPGLGGVVVITVIVLAATIYVLLTRWILKGGETEEDAWRRRG